MKQLLVAVIVVIFGFSSAFAGEKDTKKVSSGFSFSVTKKRTGTGAAGAYSSEADITVKGNLSEGEELHMFRERNYGRTRDDRAKPIRLIRAADFTEGELKFDNSVGKKGHYEYILKKGNKEIARRGINF